MTPGGTAPRTKMSSSGLWRSMTSGGSRRSIRAISARVSGSEPACAPGDERFVRFARTRISGSIPGGKVKVASDSQVADGKLRLRSTPAAFCLVPASSPSGLSTGITAQRVSEAGIRSSSRRTSSEVSASSPCCPAVSRPPRGPSPCGRNTRSGRSPRERPYSSTRQPSSSLPRRSLTGPRSAPRRRAFLRPFP